MGGVATGVEACAARLRAAALCNRAEKSARAGRKVTGGCQSHLHGRYDLEIVDLYQQPELAAQLAAMAITSIPKLKPSAGRREGSARMNSASRAFDETVHHPLLARLVD